MYKLQNDLTENKKKQDSMDTSLYILHAVTKWKNSVSSNIRRGEGQQQGSFCVFFLAVFCLFGWTTRKIIVWRNKEVK